MAPKAAKNGTANRIAGAAAAQPEGQMRINIMKPKLIMLKVRIRGISPLLICRFDEKTRGDIEDAMAGKAKGKKAPKNAQKEFDAARYVSRDGWDGFNAVSIRAAMIEGARMMDNVTMTSLKQAVFIVADGYDRNRTPLIKIDGKPEPFTNMCRTTTGVAYPRTRPLYDPWEATIRMNCNGYICTAEQYVNLLSLAGMFGGIGEWRPTAKKSLTGEYGRFEVINAEGD